MPQYTYVAMDGAAKQRKGKLNAANKTAAEAELRAKGLFPIEIKEIIQVQKVKAANKGKGLNMSFGPMVIKRKELTVVTRQLAILLGAGLPLIRSLKTLEKQAKNPVVAAVLGQTSTIVEGGATFAEALEQNPKSFDKLYLNMVRAGEASGAMEVILDRLAGFMEKAARIAGKVKSAMIYPSVILSISILAVVGLMIFIVPNFSKIFSDLLGPDEPLPGITTFLINCSNSMVETWYYWLIGVLVIVVAYKVASKTTVGKFGIDYCKYNMPLFGPIIAKTAVARFSRTLGTLMSSGVPVLSALAIVKETSGNEVVSKAVGQVYDAVKEGEGISVPLGRTKVFPEMVISMVEVGEETGKLPEMLDKIANTYDEEVDNAVGALTSLIEPLMIVGLAGIVGTIVIALFLPLTKIIEKMSG
ncbi:MAG: type II secretion system F family protein [Lentisphaerae bacterium]|nr:type II secretion system F family protein [Lentisphaerota bacterium]